MRRDRAWTVVALVLMAVVSLTNPFGISAAGISVILGIVAFFVFKTIERRTLQESGLGFKSLGEAVRRPLLLVLILLPSIMNFLVIFLARRVLPDYIEHVASRSAVMLSIDTLPILIIQLLVFAVGEEIAWRAFFQKRLGSFMPVVPTMLIASALFSLGHLTSGDLPIVAYDLLFVFVNSLLYGFIFRETNNAWMSAASHFSANLLAVVLLFIP